MNRDAIGARRRVLDAAWLRVCNAQVIVLNGDRPYFSQLACFVLSRKGAFELRRVEADQQLPAALDDRALDGAGVLLEEDKCARFGQTGLARIGDLAPCG